MSVYSQNSSMQFSSKLKTAGAVFIKVFLKVTELFVVVALNTKPHKIYTFRYSSLYLEFEITAFIFSEFLFSPYYH